MMRQPVGRRSIAPVRDGDLLLLRPARAGEVLGVSRVTIYALLAVGKLKSLRIGRSRLITVASIRALVDSGGVTDLDGATKRRAAGRRSLPLSTGRGQ
jgi:excisionase family DNA binding protein